MPAETESSKTSPPDYVLRVNWAIDYILAHLHEPIRLDDVAKVACFSPFHFHRVFRSLLGETLQDFVTRVRLERALRILSFTPNRSLTEIALSCGFNTSSNFSRVFKQRYGVPPSQFNLAEFRDLQREKLVASIPDGESNLKLTRLPPGENPDGFVVTMREIPARSVSYIRVLDPYRADVVTDAARRLMAWAEGKGLLDGQWLGYMWDDPGIVDHKDCRYDVGVETVGVAPEGEVGRFEFPQMLVAEVEVKGAIDLEQRAIDWVFGTWLPQSGYVPSTQPCFESWIGLPFAHGFEYFEINAQFPVEKA